MGKVSYISAFQAVFVSGERPFPCPFGGCVKAYIASYQLARHIREVHGEKPFKCEKCKKRFNKNLGLIDHKYSAKCVEQEEHENYVGPAADDNEVSAPYQPLFPLSFN